ncbi:hypothetical protein CERSUDRAFT_59878 [Gelatoporia subvermispora B]|uniref:Uncharacterized protein n=1 Tax=Ceriporiopsis subvermispora (strain B) TaxID=914234 RepID=M2QYA5_CERS8|nr:hypothetical protein CERSUDRAFT_59878 [Gelatoporia subvermispora B]
MFWLTSIVLTFSLGRLSACGAVSEGGACSTKNDRIDPNTRKFMSDCNDQTYCNAMTNGTCQARQCRKDEFPFGYGLGDTIPPLCSRGSFCPDSGSGCQPLRQAGQSCELNRDDQCAPAPNWQQLASSQNTDGSLCLQTTCIFANASIGQSCIIDETTYIDTGAGGQQYSNVIVRHNCETPHLYCDRTHLQCFKAKPIGISCSSDEECSSLNCNSGVCSDPPGTPLQVAPWQYAAISSGVFAAMITILTLLILVHKRLRLRHYRAVREYYDEQLR